MKEYLSWEQVSDLIDRLIDKVDIDYKNIHGIPRGGLPIAVIMSHRTGKPITLKPSLDTLVVDDICDKGNTLLGYMFFPTATLHYKPNEQIKPTFYVEQTNNWIVYPWETEESSKADYEVKK